MQDASEDASIYSDDIATVTIMQALEDITGKGVKELKSELEVVKGDWCRASRLLGHAPAFRCDDNIVANKLNGETAT